MAKVRDMTKGNETSLLLNFMLPMLLGNIFQQFYNIVDSAIVGRFEGSTALGAIGCTGSLNFLFFSFFNGLSVGAGILVAQSFGAKNKELVKKTIANSLYIVGAAGLLISILGIVLARPILTFMETPAVQLEDAIVYMRIISVGTVAVAVYNFVAQSMRALGDSKTPLVFLIISSFINVVLDILFVCVFKWSVFGAGLATIISQGFSALMGLGYCFLKNPYFKFSKEHIRFDKKIALKSFKVGMPIACQGMLIALSCVILQRVTNSFNEIAVSAYTVTIRIEQLVQQPFASLGSALSSFTGQNMGAGKPERVKNAMRKATIMVLGFSALMLCVCNFMGENIVTFFVKEKDVISLGGNGLKITSAMYFFLGMIYVTRGILNGTGDVFYAMLNGIMEIIGRVGFSLILVGLVDIGVYAIWFTSGLTWVITALTGIIRYKQGKWHNYKMIDKKV